MNDYYAVDYKQQLVEAKNAHNENDYAGAYEI